MTATPSTMLPLGTKAPPFNLTDTEGNRVTLRQFEDANVLLVVFMCNHCPYVKHVREKLLAIIREYQEKGVAAIGISSNDTEATPGHRCDPAAW